MARWCSVISVAHQFQKLLVNAGIVAELGMERGGHGLPFSYDDRIVAFRSHHFHARAQMLDLWRADKHHFQRRLAELSGTNRAVDLASVGVAADADVERSQAWLRRVGDFL